MLAAEIVASTPGQTAACRRLYSSAFSGRSRLQSPIRFTSASFKRRASGQAQIVTAAFRRHSLDRIEIPGYAEAWRRVGLGAAVANPHRLAGQVVQLRNEFQPAGVRNRAAQRDMQ